MDKPVDSAKEHKEMKLIPEYQCMREMDHVKSTNYKTGTLLKPLPSAPSVFRSTSIFDGIFNKGNPPTTNVTSGLTDNSSIGMYGEDTVIKLSMHQKSLPRLVVVGVLDGHGGNLLASCTAGELYITKFKERYQQLVEVALADHSALKTILIELASEIESELAQIVATCGGCTMSITGIVESHVNRIVFNMNLGDSSTYMRTDSVVQQINTDHSADNIDAYSAHYFENKKAGYTPSPIVYGRFNVNGKLNVPYPDWTGQYKPFVMFIESDNKTLTVNPKAEAWMKKVYKDYVGGMQSIRKYVGTREPGKLEVLPGYGHVNWGSTIMGDSQCLKSHGDLETTQKYKTSHIPDINIYCPQPHEDVTIVTGSDGLWDLMWTMEVFDIVKCNEFPHKNAQAIIDAIKTKCSISKLQSEGYSYKTLSDGKTLKAGWDDVSFAIYHSPGDLLCKNLHDRGVSIHDIGEACLDGNCRAKNSPKIYRSASAGTNSKKKLDIDATR